MVVKKSQEILDLEAAAYFELRKRQFASMKKKRLGIFHVSDYVNDCLRNAYYGHLKSMRGSKMTSKALSVFFRGEAVHQLLDSAVEGGFGETAVAWNFVTDEPVDLTKSHGIEEWMQCLIGEYDATMIYDENTVLMDWKTWRPNGFKLKAAKPEHKMQVNYYSYLIKKTQGVDVKGGVVVYLDADEDYEKPLALGFKLDTIETIQERLMATYQQFRSAYETGILPDRVFHWRCNGYCPYIEHCVNNDKIDIEKKMSCMRQR